MVHQPWINIGIKVDQRLTSRQPWSSLTHQAWSRLAVYQPCSCLMHHRKSCLTHQPWSRMMMHQGWSSLIVHHARSRLTHQCLHFITLDQACCHASSSTIMLDINLDQPWWLINPWSSMIHQPRTILISSMNKTDVHHDQVWYQYWSSWPPQPWLSCPVQAW